MGETETFTYLVEKEDVTAIVSDSTVTVSKARDMPQEIFDDVVATIDAALKAEGIDCKTPNARPEARRYINIQGDAAKMKNTIIATLQAMEIEPTTFRDSIKKKSAAHSRRADEDAAKKVVDCLSNNDVESLLGDTNPDSVRLKLEMIINKAVVASRQQARGQGHG